MRTLYSRRTIMTQKFSRRQILKVIAAGSAGLAGSGLLKASAQASFREKNITTIHRAQGVKEVKYWQPPIWRYGADNKTVTGAGSDEWIADAIKRFEAKHSDIKVNLELIPWDSWGQKTATAFSSGQVPNILYGNWSIDKVMSG